MRRGFSFVLGDLKISGGSTWAPQFHVSITPQLAFITGWGGWRVCVKGVHDGGKEQLQTQITKKIKTQTWS